jgi:hypothetical protein
MYIKKENVDKALDITREKWEEYENYNSMDYMLLLGYKNTLDIIAKKSKYQEGEKISESDLANIKSKVNDIINFMARELKQKENTIDKIDKRDFDAFDMLMAANDYLYAQAMVKLGCPDIPTSFGADVCQNIQKHAKTLDKTIKKTYFDEEFSIKDYFDKQRKMSAESVRHKNKDLIYNAKTKIIDQEQLAELVAEYQALNLRQDGHGAIWRFFHRTENNERNELLADMKDAITKAIGADAIFDIIEKTPSDIAATLNNQLIDKKGIEAVKPDVFVKRCNLSGEMVSYESIPAKQSLAKQENSANNDKRVSIEVNEGGFIENNGVDVSPAVSNNSISKDNPQLNK